MKRTAMIVSACLCASFTLGLSQEAPSSHEQAVVELFELMGLERTMMGSATAMIDAQIQNNPALGPYRDVLLAWAGKYLTWEAMAPALVRMQMEVFTESEIREMIAFYSTPTGQKALTQMPELFQKGAALGAEVARLHQAELEAMVQKRQQELEEESKKP